jgi:hypothetical protein
MPGSLRLCKVKVTLSRRVVCHQVDTNRQDDDDVGCHCCRRSELSVADSRCAVRHLSGCVVMSQPDLVLPFVGLEPWAMSCTLPYVAPTY